jgi:hypothetical protein
MLTDASDIPRELNGVLDCFAFRFDLRSSLLSFQ